jgi:hypothetical protein
VPVRVWLLGVPPLYWSTVPETVPDIPPEKLARPMEAAAFPEELPVVRKIYFGDTDDALKELEEAIARPLTTPPLALMLREMIKISEELIT